MRSRLMNMEKSKYAPDEHTRRGQLNHTINAEGKQGNRARVMTDAVRGSPAGSLGRLPTRPKQPGASQARAREHTGIGGEVYWPHRRSSRTYAKKQMLAVCV
jgi:hypothetical protein